MHAPPKGLIYSIYYISLAAIGVPANVMTLVILSRAKCGLSRCVNCYLESMVVTDLLVIFTAVILSRISVTYAPGTFLSLTPVCSISSVLVYVARDSSVWLTVAFTFDRFVAITCQNLKTKYCTGRSAALIIGSVCALSCVKNIPFYFIYQPSYVINGVPWYCNVKWNFYHFPIWKAFNWIDCILTPWLPFIFILLLNILTVRYIVIASRARRRLRTSELQCDPEAESRKKSIILLFAISGSFILLWMTYVANFLYVEITKDKYSAGFNLKDPKFVFREVGNMLQLLSSCTNTCIYAVTQTKFRQQMYDALKYPFKLFFAVIH
ncbi:probable G-protein coupled receptor 139 [Mobula birostris]|uniref:probable G-protein coupled receptor 139 n=1 Tax=Mobula birostris TaxID=1983395 RepID=UPI003B27C61C